MKARPVLLKGANKAKKPANTVAGGIYDRRRLRTRRQQHAHEKALARSTPPIHELFPEVHPLVLAAVSQHLDTPRDEDRMILDAWERVGRRDARRCAGKRAQLPPPQAFTALGLACLVRYERGFDDERQALEAEATDAASS
jgi:hypothetical protein